MLLYILYQKHSFQLCYNVRYKCNSSPRKGQSSSGRRLSRKVTTENVLFHQRREDLLLKLAKRAKRSYNRTAFIKLSGLTQHKDLYPPQTLCKFLLKLGGYASFVCRYLFEVYSHSFQKLLQRLCYFARRYITQLV